MSRNCRKCELCGKGEYGTYKAKLFYTQFPLNEDRCRQWLRLVGNPDLVSIPIERLHKTKFLCGEHFNKKAMNKTRTRTKRTAVPSINISATPLTDEQLSGFPQRNAPMESSTDQACTSTATVAYASTSTFTGDPVTEYAVASISELSNTSKPSQPSQEAQEEEEEETGRGNMKEVCVKSFMPNLKKGWTMRAIMPLL